MDNVIVVGKVDSEIKVINTNNGSPLCRFTLLMDNHKFNCIIAGKKAFDFVYKVKFATEIRIDATINSRNQLVVQDYRVIASPNYFGMVFDYKGRRLPHKKTL